MSQAAHALANRPRPRGTVAQVATTIFIGIPMTMGMLIALGCYCSYEYARFALLGQRAKTKSRPVASPSSSESFTASLANLAHVHGPTAHIEVLAQDKKPAEATNSLVQK